MSGGCDSFAQLYLVHDCVASSRDSSPVSLKHARARG
jgi:hypothetical protein